jgi:hypothetical protein
MPAPLDNLLHQAVGVRPRGIDPQEERFQEGALARRHLRQPAKEAERGAQIGVGASPGADQDQAADQLGMPQRQLLGDSTPSRLADDVSSRDLKCPQQSGDVVGHVAHRERLLQHGRPPGPGAVKGGDPVAVRKPLQLELPGLGGIAQPGDDQHLRPLSAALNPELEASRPHLFTHGDYPPLGQMS